MSMMAPQRVANIPYYTISGMRLVSREELDEMEKETVDYFTGLKANQDREWKIRDAATKCINIARYSIGYVQNGDTWRRWEEALAEYDEAVALPTYPTSQP